MSVLSADLRRTLERAVLAGRGVAEAAAASAVARLGVGLRDAPMHLTVEEKALRVALRARARQLGDSLDKSSDPGDVEVACPLLVSQVAYEQWHRFLFARFLEANHLLHHPEFGVPVSLTDCEELAADLGEPDGWSVGARFAAQVLPGIFKPFDPSVRIRLTREDLISLETVVVGIPGEVFAAEDALGWVYQYWQSKAKDAVNASGRKVGGRDLSPVTQLFTENYMVRFLLENSLGAWWAGVNPESSLLTEYEYLRLGEGANPAVGTFEDWPSTVAEITVMDPCCGSGHFLVAAFGMLWQMRAEAEGLSPSAAQDAVLRDNLFGLELDPRCTQIAMFALALEAWKQGGYRALPTPQVACSGIPAKAPLADWTVLADDDAILGSALARLHALFADADTLGSLINPVRAAEDAGLESVDWHEVAPLVQRALNSGSESGRDPSGQVFGEAAAGIAQAADLLSRKYSLVATNVPYLELRGQDPRLSHYLLSAHPEARYDLATAMIERCLQLAHTCAAVSPQNWLLLKSYEAFRRVLLRQTCWDWISWLGSGAFGAISGEVVNVVLTIHSWRPPAQNVVHGLDASSGSVVEKSESLRSMKLSSLVQNDLLLMPDVRISLDGPTAGLLLERFASGLAGIMTGDSPRFTRYFWEVESSDAKWEYFQSTVSETALFGGKQSVLLWEGGRGGTFFGFHRENRSKLHDTHQRGSAAWGRKGIAVRSIGNLPASLYSGDRFDNNVAVVLPKKDEDLAAVWAYISSEEFHREVRRLDRKMNVTNATLVKVPFDAERWRAKAAEDYPAGLPEPWSDDATQWLFRGEPVIAQQSLQVALARLVGFRWPDQEPDSVDALVDGDGIVCLPAVAGEQPAAERVRALLAASLGEDWSSSKLDELLVAAGGMPGDLGGWLSTTFFKDHCKIFGNRPFVWHIWDGLKDGFSALVNYHRLDRPTLEKLTYRTLGWWIDRQRADADSGVLGADARLGAAQTLQAKLQLILEGEPPYDIYVRWKALSEQPIGWNPDLDDGVRANIRPFVEAGVLRSKFTIHWKKDRGTDSDGLERHNDRHHSVAEKRKARGLT